MITHSLQLERIVVIMNKFNNRNAISYLKYGTTGFVALAFTTLIAISLTAQANDGEYHCEHKHWGQQDRIEHFQKHQQELHNKLGITATQEKAWDDYIAKTKPNESYKKQDWTTLSKLSTPERMDAKLVRIKEREQRFEVKTQATKDLYKQLTLAQKTIFDQATHHQRYEHESHEHNHC